MSAKILITGGAGFIGSHLAKRLIDSGQKVVIVDNLNDYYDPRLKKDRLKIFLGGKNFDFEKIDISDYDKLKPVFKKHKFDKIFHLAAQAGVRYSLTNPWAYEKSNFLGTMNIFELAKEFKVPKIVFASSSSVYGGNTKIPFSEQDNVDKPISLYAATKRANELTAYTYYHLYGIKSAGLRFFTVYGPWGRPDMAYFKFTDLIKQGKPVDVYNHGKMKRDFTYIDDIIDGIVSAMEKSFDFEIFNLGGDNPVDLEKFIGLIEKNLGIKAKKNYLPMQAGDVLKTWADLTKSKKMLGFKPKVPVEKGIEKFIEWYKNYKIK